MIINNCVFASIYISLLLYEGANITFALTIKPVSLEQKLSVLLTKRFSSESILFTTIAFFQLSSQHRNLERKYCWALRYFPSQCCDNHFLIMKELENKCNISCGYVIPIVPQFSAWGHWKFATKYYRSLLAHLLPLFI